ncbi:GtrA family protein [Paenibacillus albiflavus]|nr:GtrA family protein [Paenibacillus albiflavus]
MMGTVNSVLNRSFVRFLLVGVLNTIIGLSASFILFNLFEMNYWAATFGGNTIGAIVSYFLNRKFTFRSNVSVASSWWKFMLVIVACYFISYGISLWLSPLILHIFPDVSVKATQNIAILFGNGIYTILNYFGHKLFTFRSKQTSQE